MNEDSKVTKESAYRILEEDSEALEQIPSLRTYFQSVIEDTLPEYYLNRFNRFKGYSDDLPKPEVDPSHENYGFLRLKAGWDHPKYPHLKCRGNVICGISVNLQHAVKDGVLGGGLMEDFRDYDFSFSKGRKGEFWTTSEEIDFINKTLDLAIAQIKEKYSL